MEYEESREEEVGKGDRIGEQHGGEVSDIWLPSANYLAKWVSGEL